MFHRMLRFLCLIMIANVTSLVEKPAIASPLRLDLATLPSIDVGEVFHFGTSIRPGGETITANRICLLRDGKPWLATMGEFHFARYAQSEWRDELLKMKAGGIEIVASYVFWIHHEETPGVFNWRSERDLRTFIELCKELDLSLVLRIGPWGHGEVRNGGLPEWLLDVDGLKLRTDDPNYLARLKPFYEAIAQQAKGLLWKDGGPVIAIQLENEYHGDSAHLLTLKKFATDAGLDVPLYTRTGWPELSKPMPPGEMLPLHGGYAEGFWDRSLVSMPGNYWRDFCFSHKREAASVATDHFGQFQLNDEEEARHYPYFNCEMGGGMMCSYHRRIRIDPRDIIAIAIVKLGSGANLLGYYMYHGGVNPNSSTGITLNERQATRNTNHNDLPVKTYDFQAPLGEAGQLRPHYHLLRRLHLFLREFGSELAMMPAVLPDNRQRGKDDVETLRWAVRSDGTSGYLFLNNYQRGIEMSAKSDVWFQFSLASGNEIRIPSGPIIFPASSSCIWPFNLRLQDDIKLAWATAQPICRLEVDAIRYTVMAPTPGVATELAFEGDVSVSGASNVARMGGPTIVRDVLPGALRVRAAGGTEHVMLLLDDAAALSLYKLKVGDRERLLLTSAAVLSDGNTLRLQGESAGEWSFSLFPAPQAIEVDGKPVSGVADGIFTRYSTVRDSATLLEATIELLKLPGPPRTIVLGRAHVAEQPSDADFDAAAVYRIELPAGLDLTQAMLRVNYVGDAARLYAGETLLTDNFYNGTSFDLALWRYAADIERNGLTLKVLPLQKAAPIYLARESWPDIRDGDAFQSVRSIELIRQAEVGVTCR